MSTSADFVQPVGPDLHRITFQVYTIESWYAIMREARALYGKNWRCQRHIRRRLMRTWSWSQGPGHVWFEVPDPQFGTWCALKLGGIQTPVTNK